MDSNLESQLNIKLASNPEFRLIIDDTSPKFLRADSLSKQSELGFQLDLVSEDRERLKLNLKSLQLEKIGLVQDFAKRKQVHEELRSLFINRNARILKELELEAKVLKEAFVRKSNLLAKMRGMLKSPVKETNHTERGLRRKTLDYGVLPIKPLAMRESLSPAKTSSMVRRQKIAAFRNSLCN